MPFSDEETIRVAKAKAAREKAAIKNRQCVVHYEEVPSRIKLLAEAGATRKIGKPHPWTSECRALSPAERQAVINRKQALVAEAQQASLEEVEIINGRMAEDADDDWPM